MTIKELYHQLAEAYSDENLNHITGRLIEMYRCKNFLQIREVANKISKFVVIDDENDARCFSRLIMLYHPDKGDTVRKQLEQYYSNGDFESLYAYSHILTVEKLDFGPTLSTDPCIDYHPEYGWDRNDKKNRGKDDFTGADEERSFYNAVKLRMYGDTDVEFPPYYLEDFDEFELSSQGVETLDGVEYCIHVKTLDLSDNHISDISALWDLERLEELYLQGNRIGYIDALSNLLNLRVVDLSFNMIDDLSPLFGLEKLEFVNISGNRVQAGQIMKLTASGVLVVF